MTEQTQTSACVLIARMKSGELSAIDVANAYIAQVEKLEPEIQAFSWFDADYVREQAKQLDMHRMRGLPTGPLYGLPVALKDIIDTKAIPTENGTALDSGRVPTEDAVVVQKLRSAGAIIFGKTRTTELAFMDPCETRNPHNIERTPGGSSSGSAAAVAAGMVPVALGTQTGGSVIRPASFCGTFAIKPSFGMISRSGVLLQSPSLDTLGVFATSVEDLGLMLDVLAGFDPQDKSTSLSPAPQALKIAMDKPPVPPTFAMIQPPGIENASDDMMAALKELRAFLGDQAFETGLPAAFGEALKARETINFAEMAKCYYRYTYHAKDQLGEKLQGAIRKGEEAMARDYIAALDWPEILNAGLEELFDRCDALILPSALGAAPGLETTGDPVFNSVWTLCGTPVVNLPVFNDADGMPMGIQLVGPKGDDARLLRAARWLSETLKHAQIDQEVA